MSHGLDSKLMVAQSQAIGIPLIQREVTWDTYEDGFKAAMRARERYWRFRLLDILRYEIEEK